MDKIRPELWIGIFHTEKENRRILGWGDSIIQVQSIMSVIHSLDGKWWEESEDVWVAGGKNEK